MSPDVHASGMQVDEVIVTARRVREELSAVPSSVQVLSGERLDQGGLSSLYQLQFEVPGLVVSNRGMFGAGLALRGVTDEGGGSLAIAPHVNGVYLGRSNLALARQFDIERVEVVKGPQGTLYGRNATGGSFNVVTRTPASEFGGAVEAAVGSFDTTRLQAHVDLPARRFAARLAVTGSEGDGFIRNSVDARRFAADDYAGARLALRAEPTAATTIDLMLQRVEDDGAAGELWLPRKDQLPDPGEVHLTTVTDPDPYLRARDELATLELAHGDDGLRLRSVTGYGRHQTRARDDCAGVPVLVGCVRGVQPLRFRQLSQELRLESATTRGARWVMGAFYFHSQESIDYFLSAPRLAPTTLNDTSTTSEETVQALFGEATRSVGEHWRATAGLRLSRERQRVTDIGRGVADRPGLAVGTDVRDDLSWRLAAEFSPDERLLAYGSVATGFKAGGISTQRLPDGELDRYDSEQLLAYEAGLNLGAPDRSWTLRASAFLYEYRDMQVRTTRLLAGQVVTDTDNAAAARIEGVDLAAAARVAGRLTFSGALVWLPRREFVRFADALSGDLLSGNDISRAPEWSATASIGYRLPIARLGELAAEADFAWRSGFFFTKENDPLLAQGAFGLLNLRLRLESRDRGWYAFASGFNVLGADHFDQVFLQSAPGRPARYELGFGMRL